MEPILRLVHGLSLPHFTHFTVRYSDLSSFPYSSCQTRQEASDGGTLLLPLCFGPFDVGLISGYVVQLYYHNISGCQHLNAKFLTVGFEPQRPCTGATLLLVITRINLLVKNLYRVKAHVRALQVGTRHEFELVP